MKYKLLLLFLISILFTYLIFTKNYQNTLQILSIYDKTTAKEENYNINLEYKEKNIILSQKEDKFSKENLEIENIISIIKENNEKIQNNLYLAKTIVLHLGEFELSKEDITIPELITQLESLFKLLRIYNKNQIIYISPQKTKSQYLLKELCKKYQINFINIQPYIINKEENKTIDNISLSKSIISTIINAWNL